MDRIQIIDYIMSTPYNVNWNVLSTMLDEGDWSELKAYVEQTPHNMNRKVLEVLLGDEEPVSYRTVLYTDGTFIINESSRNQVANETLHGEATNVYNPFDPNGTTNIKKYIFTSASQRPWNSKASSVKAVEIGSNIQPTNTAYWFQGFTTCASMNLGALNTSAVTAMANMFNNCRALTSLDVTHFNTSAVTNMSYMFYYCQALTTLDVTHFDTSAVTNMSNMFYGCYALTTLDVSHFNTGAVTSMSYMFCDCRALTSLDVTHFNTSTVTSMNSMFSYCYALTSLDVSSFNTSAVTNMNSMFNNCQALITLDVSHFNTSAVTDMASMFNGCQALTTIYASANFVVTQVTSSSYMFGNMSTNLVGGSGTTWPSTYLGKTYARIDNPPDAPGYFTAKA